MQGRPFRFLHTADWQMGMKAAGLGEAGERVRHARLEAAERVIAAAAAHRVECIVIAGDLFEDNAVEALLVQQVADILGRAPCPVFVLPGNHDPLVAGSVYDREVWKRTERVTVWRGSEPQEIRPGVTLFPCPYLSRQLEDDPLAWIPAREPEDSAIRVGIAHGSLLATEAMEDESASPIDPDGASRYGLDYLALGHWHSTFVYPNGPTNRVAYSGAHEATKFGERDSGNVLFVEIEAPGAAPKMQPVHTGTLTWRQEPPYEVHSVADLERILHVVHVEDESAARTTLVEMTLRGVASTEVAARVRDDLGPLLQARHLFSRLITEELLLEPSEAELLAIAPAGPVRTACERLLEKIAAAPDAKQRAVAQMALAELYALSREVTA